MPNTRDDYPPAPADLLEEVGMERVYVMAGSYLGSAGFSVRAGCRPTSAMMPMIELEGEERGIKVRL